MKYTKSSHVGKRDRTGGDYAKEPEYTTCPECGQIVQIVRGRRISFHTYPDSPFPCDGSNQPVNNDPQDDN